MPIATDAAAQASAQAAVQATLAAERLATRESSAKTYARNLPIVPMRASGTTITATDGRTYLDCLSGAGALALGHNHPVVIEAIRRALDDEVPLATLDLATPLKDAFTEALFATLPPELASRGRIHFCGPTGADAVEAALKLAQTATGRRGILTFTGAYHGMTLGALSVTGNVQARSPIAMAGEITRLPYPYSLRCPFGVGGDEGARLSSHYLERLLDDPNGGVGPSAGLIVEPVQGEGGVVPAPDEWLRAVRRITLERDIPLIADEVQTGVGRTGAFWAVDHAGVTPDILVLSKAIGGGLPLAVIVYDEALDGWQPGAHTGTFRGNQLAMAAGAATLEFIASNELHERAFVLGVRIKAALEQFAKDRSSIAEIRGRGLMIGIESTAPGLPALVRAEALRRGLILEVGGRQDSVVRLMPPLTISDQEVDSVLSRLTEAWIAAEAEL